MAQKKTFSISQIAKSKDEIIKILNEWESSSLKRDKIMSLHKTVTNWNKIGGGLKKRQSDLKKNIKALTVMMKRTPNESLKSLIDGFEKELLVVEEEIKNKPKSSK